jgi:hypothetical protein
MQARTCFADKSGTKEVLYHCMPEFYVPEPFGPEYWNMAEYGIWYCMTHTQRYDVK